ncbi:hypothetical protein [Ruegeria sp. HKCCD8929]|uniref:hypothetical protein n=1 Tax=Ruegeria sp. HKCCD8929 TaxID=2683006 RepID=UPI0014878BA7|nr:hypothetical protein [Ruegeria sp. HKCCD8929]
MKWFFRILVGLIVLAGVGAVGISYFFGSLRVQREAAAYIDALETCAPFEQQAWAPILRGSMKRTVAGTEDGSCIVTIEALGSGQMRCALDDDAMALMTRYVQDGADTVTFLGGQSVSLRYSSENPDPVTELFNGPSCVLEQ